MRILAEGRSIQIVYTDWLPFPFPLTRESYTFPVPVDGRVVALEGSTPQRTFFLTLDLPTVDRTATIPRSLLRKLLENDAQRLRILVASDVVRKTSFVVSLVSEEEVAVRWRLVVEGGRFSDKTTEKTLWLEPGQSVELSVEADQGLVVLRAHVAEVRRSRS